jgi:hypothetical protein
LSYVDGKTYNGSRPLKHLCTVLYKNYAITNQLLKTSASKHLEILKSLGMKLAGGNLDYIYVKLPLQNQRLYESKYYTMNRYTPYILPLYI